MTEEHPAPSSSEMPRPASSAGSVLKVVLPIALIGLAAYWWSTTLEAKARRDSSANVVSRMFASEPMPKNRKMAFPDTDQDLVADLPADEAKLIKPDTLVFSYVATDDGGPPDETWTELLAALKEKTGRDVKLVKFTTPDEQLAALQKGELHIAGLNTGLVQAAVERDGFVPLCTPAKDDGTWGYTMEFLVPAGSKIKDLSQIKGRKVMFARLDSNSGCKAPLVLLKEKYDLLPGRDYEWGFSLGHEDSIKNIASKDYEVAPVASDMLAQMIEKKEVDPAAVVSIYKSERFPPATIGYVYNLAPELRDAIRDTLINFSWAGTGLEKEFGPGAMKFVAINYKDDFANTRRIDQVIAESRKSNGRNGS